MIIFEQMRPFVFFCQILAIFPFYIESDPESKKFKKFSFSLKHPVTCWFLLVLFLQITFLGLMSLITWKFFFEDDQIRLSVPRILTDFFYLEHIWMLLFIVLVRFLLVKYPSIRKVVNIVQNVHNALGVEDFPLEGIPPVKKRLIQGLWLAIFSTVVLVGSTASLFSIFAAKQEFFFFIILSIGGVFLILMVMLMLLFLYLCYFVIACYIQLVALDLKLAWLQVSNNITVDDNVKVPTKAPEISDSKTVPKTRKSNLKRSKQIYGDLCAALAEVNQIFSMPVFIILSSRLISTSFCLYIIFNGIIRENPILKAMIPATAASCLVGYFIILVVCSAADLPITQAKKLRETIFIVSNANNVIDVEAEIETWSFIQQLSEDRIRLSAMGLFQVGVHLLPTLTASVVTYLVILLQSDLV